MDSSQANVIREATFLHNTIYSLTMLITLMIPNDQNLGCNIQRLAHYLVATIGCIKKNDREKESVKCGKSSETLRENKAVVFRH